MSPDDVRIAWSKLVENGTPPDDLDIALQVLPELTVGIDGWIERLSKRYLQDLCRRSSHFKLVLGQYGSGKTHFLLALLARALRENYAVSFLKCKEGVSLEEPLTFYQQIVANLRLPGNAPPGVHCLFETVHANWKARARQAPDEVYAWQTMLEDLEKPVFPFGRVAAAALRHIEAPSLNRELGTAAFLWLSGYHKNLTPKDRTAFRLSGLSKKELQGLGHALRNTLIGFIPQAGVHGLVLLVDETENMMSARGRALARVLNAMRTIIDEGGSDNARMRLLCVFAAIHDIRDPIQQYQALKSRLSVVGQPFHDGSDSAAEIDLEHLGRPKEVLAHIGQRLLAFGEKALSHAFKQDIQQKNLQRLTEVVAVRRLEADARRLFVKAFCALLEEQISSEKIFTTDELQSRVSGAFAQIKGQDEQDEGHA